jgi:S1-C subfamily serine protease
MAKPSPSRRPLPVAALALTFLLGGCAAHRAGGGAPPPTLPQTASGIAERIVEASVTVAAADGRPRCGGAVAVRSDLVVTAAHCLRELAPGDAVVVGLDGEDRPARLAAMDRETDVAVLLLDEPSEVRPLPLADSDLARPGEPVLFLGRPDFGRDVQEAEVERRAPCPDLAAVSDAVFATHRGVPGDSGAPLVGKGGIVALIHGGARCHIAIPSNALGPVVWQALAREGEVLPAAVLGHRIRPRMGPHAGEDPVVAEGLDALASGDLKAAREAAARAGDAGSRLTLALSLANGASSRTRESLHRYLERAPDAVDAPLVWALLAALEAR